MRSQNVDVILRCFDVRIFRRHFLEAFVPIRHGDGDAIGFGGGRYVFLAACFRQFKSVLENAINTTPRKDRLLHANFVFCAAVEPPADGGIFTFVVFAHDPEIDVAGFASREWRRHAGHQAHRADIGIKLKLATDRNQQTP